jgi:hypothetical protein
VSKNKPRLMVLTDIGGDPDDEQSLVRLLTFANEVDIVGIVPEMWAGHKGRHGVLTPGSQMDVVYEAIDLYGQVKENLSLHAEGYPDAEALKAVVKRGMANVRFTLDEDEPEAVWKWIGEGKDTEGSEWIIEVVDQDDERPVDVNVWGGTADLAQALWKVRETRSANQVSEFVSRIRVHAIADQDDTGPWIRDEFPDLFYIFNMAPDGNKWHACFRGMFLGGDESLTSLAWLGEHVREGHGPLGAFYPPKTHTASNPHKALKEGDTPSWFYFLENGLNVPGEPSYGGWGGRFARNDTFWQDAEDTVGDETSGIATTWRWRPAYQSAFQARMDWCVKEYDEANHEPVVVINGEEGKGILYITAKPGETVNLSAVGSSDPDGDALSYHWYAYREAGLYGGEIVIDAAHKEDASFVMPDAKPGETVHIILEVTDDGEPPLTSYRRIVVIAS